MASGTPSLPLDGRRVPGRPEALACNAVTIRVEPVGVTRVCTQDGLRLAGERGTVERVSLADERPGIEPIGERRVILHGHQGDGCGARACR